ncbi:Indole-diterpene biosynthesis protein PaxU [Madurella fahalii]|uniref:Indole-diterpene biosynthesis protein PaxU n=1 Tax=Madurella fahalii TaxID=1157608 RepID=A0ABQ0G4N2_9PEZI
MATMTPQPRGAGGLMSLREARVAAIAARAILEQDYEVQTSAHGDDAADPPSRPRLLVHVFSNAGSTMLYHLYTAYAATAGFSSSSDGVRKTATLLPLHATVFDSAPAPFTYQTLLQGILDSAPSAAARLAVTPLAYVYVALVWVVVALLRLPDHIGDLGPRAHNDPARAREAGRVYLYGPADRITPAAGIERHADEAASRGFRVRREVFAGMGHVVHARKHADRYWCAVRRAWEEASRLEG